MTKKLENITSEKFLDDSLKNAKKWCQKNLISYFLELKKCGFDYSIFKYSVDNQMGPDMCLDEKISGLIHVSIDKLKWYQEREEFFRKTGVLRYTLENNKRIIIEGEVEIDPESMFVHEITEWTLINKLAYIFQDITYLFKAHRLAHEIENINRKERELKLWPSDF